MSQEEKKTDVSAAERKNPPTRPAGTTAQANSQTKAADRVKPPVAAEGLGAAATDEAYNANNQVNPALTPVEVKAGEHEETAKKVETRKAEAVEVETKLGSSEEEAAAKRAGVAEPALDNEKQNREPKNEFESSNQKVTEQERVAAQKVSSMSVSDKEEKAPTPNESGLTDAQRTAETNRSSDVAAAIAEGFKRSKDDSFELSADAGVDPRFSLVKNKQGEVMLRENETGHLSKIQLESLEEKEASIQDQEVSEL